MIKYRGVVVPFTVEDWEAYMPDTPAKNQEIVDVLRDIWATTTRCVDLILALSPREGESAVIMLGRADVEMEQKLAQYADLGCRRFGGPPAQECVLGSGVRACDLRVR